MLSLLLLLLLLPPLLLVVLVVVVEQSPLKGQRRARTGRSIQREAA